MSSVVNLCGHKSLGARRRWIDTTKPLQFCRLLLFFLVVVVPGGSGVCVGEGMSLLLMLLIEQTGTVRPGLFSFLFHSFYSFIFTNQSNSRTTWKCLFGEYQSEVLFKCHERNCRSEAMDQIGGPNAAESGNQGEGRDQEDDQAEDGKTT